MWADGLPNLLIGLREGLEAGLVVSILLAAVRRFAAGTGGRSNSTAPIWFGVAAAIVLALSFGAVLTFYRSVLPTTGQEALGGALSVIAVVLVTGMIFWMRRTARSLAGELREKVAEAMKVSTAALAFTAFLAVGREGVETALFLWTAAQASGQTVAPLIGAAIGIAIAVLLCVLLYKGAAKIRLDLFFNRTAILLIVIAAGVLAYGLGDLQDAGWLPGHNWVAFDLSQHIDASSWWASLITGVTELSPVMTWLQVAFYLGYLAVVLTLFVREGRRAKALVAAPVAAPAEKTPEPEPAQEKHPTPSRTRALVAGAFVVPPLIAAALIGFAPGSAQAAQQITVTGTSCAAGWSSARSGSQGFTVVNKSGHTAEVNLIQQSTQGIVAEIETLGPATSQTLNATLTDGSYSWHCLIQGQATTTSAQVQVSGSGTGDPSAAPPVKPITVDELQPAADAYDRYVQPKLVTLAGQVNQIKTDLGAGNIPAAQADWLQAQLTWEQVGAAYGSFGDLGDAIDGLPQALPQGVNDPGFTGLHRIEYGLWHGQGAAELFPVADQLSNDITTLQGKLPQITVDPTDMPVRAHEILEDALRDHLTGMTDEGSGAAYAETYADVQGTQVVLGMLRNQIDTRRPGLLSTVNTQLNTLSQALLGTQSGAQWQSLTATPLAARQKVDAAIGAVLENLSIIPDILEVPAH
ncbi:MAG TPA: iron uptake transporter permease EfeU [Pseudonocardiaceae bacterium]|nr:iron uptake transporter permease EfeU [Pseudonocardiaceae bacterium]